MDRHPVDVLNHQLSLTQRLTNLIGDEEKTIDVVLATASVLACAIAQLADGSELERARLINQVLMLLHKPRLYQSLLN